MFTAHEVIWIAIGTMVAALAVGFYAGYAILKDGATRDVDSIDHAYQPQDHDLPKAFVERDTIGSSDKQ